MATKSSKMSISRVFFLVAGLLLIVKFLIEGGVPSPSGNVLNFIVGIFTLILILGFYGFFLFGAKGCDGVARSAAPAVLLLILYGRYSINFGNDNVNSILGAIANMAWILIILCGFVYLFVHSKAVGMVLSISSIIYAAFVVISYVVMLIISLTSGGKFAWAPFVGMILLGSALSLVGVAAFLNSKNKSLMGL